MNERLAHATADAAAEPAADHSIETTTSLIERVLRTLKEGDAFAVMDRYGDIGSEPDSPEGVYFRDTRYLSRYEMRIEGKRPLLLGSSIQDDNASLAVDMTNSDARTPENGGMPRDVIAIERTTFLWKGACYDRVGLRNYDSHRREFGLELRFDADFHDLFEARGMKRLRHGSRSGRVVGADKVEFRYLGLDGQERRTYLQFHPAPERLEVNRAFFRQGLDPAEKCSIIVIVSCREDDDSEPLDFLRALRDLRRDLRDAKAGRARATSSNELFDEVLARSRADLDMLTTRTPIGMYPYAGIPWYSTTFGRDGIITALLLLWLDPSIARGVLHYLAATQAAEFDPTADAQPGKILHERRQGEMARLGEVPFRQYYGTVDATPLFILLAGLYYERTGDLETISSIWPNIEAALRWCDEYGDADGDGFVEYRRETDKGLANQGWKDSWDAIFHRDGSLAEGAIALCEVQAYVFAAKRSASGLANVLGKPVLAAKLLDEAESLRQRFETAFWCEEVSTYALALDGRKRPCCVRTSNAGHALMTGIASPERAVRVANTLMGQESFSGWGIRTVSRGEARYNPMSYHNGSVWPHDNALIAMGFARYGFKDFTVRILTAMFDVAIYQDLRRLPELFCGFIRRPRRGPTGYPVACAPQAWAAAAPFALLGSCLGVRILERKNEAHFGDPVMPEFLNEVVLRDLRLRGSCVDLRLHRHGSDTTLNVLRRDGDIRVTLSK
jgi:glycogen debranching enzyme